MMVTFLAKDLKLNLLFLLKMIHNEIRNNEKYTKLIKENTRYLIVKMTNLTLKI
jgi:hypothetical protein